VSLPNHEGSRNIIKTILILFQNEIYIISEPFLNRFNIVSMIFHLSHIIFALPYKSPLYQVGDTDKVGEGTKGCVVSSLKTEIIPIYRDRKKMQKKFTNGKSNKTEKFGKNSKKKNNS
jgi:hypothetical protein